MTPVGPTALAVAFRAESKCIDIAIYACLDRADTGALYSKLSSGMASDRSVSLEFCSPGITTIFSISLESIPKSATGGKKDHERKRQHRSRQHARLFSRVWIDLEWVLVSAD